MGLALCKWPQSCRCCCCCPLYNGRLKVVSMDASPRRSLKVLMLGWSGSGKTEIGHMLSRQQRQHYDVTNGTQHYRISLPDVELSITEVGGNTEMQKIWHHYYLSTMAIIYCIDVSANHDHLEDQIKLFHLTVSHRQLRGKPLLLVATKTDLLHEGVQLYDIENAFHTENLVNSSRMTRICYFGCEAPHSAIERSQSLWHGVEGLRTYILANYDHLQSRLRRDKNIETWRTVSKNIRLARHLRRQRLKIVPNTSDQRSADENFQNLRPKTAPPKVFTIAAKELPSTTTVAK